MPVQKISKEEILSATLDAFRQKGYYNTSMEDLAQACGLHKGSFYHHFSSKEVLMKTILEIWRGAVYTKVDMDYMNKACPKVSMGFRLENIVALAYMKAKVGYGKIM